MDFYQTCIIAAVFGLLGYIIGRAGHCWLNVWMGDPAWAPHHWIYGVIGMAASFWMPAFLGLLVFWFSAGLFTSDLKDFWEFKTFEPDGDGPKRFWGID